MLDVCEADRRARKRGLAAGVAIALCVTGVGATTARAANTHATSARGTVLAVNARERTLDVVNSGDAAHGYRVSGSLPRIGFGSEISYRISGDRISHVRARARHTLTISFYATVISTSARRLSVSLSRGAKIAFPASALAGSSVQAAEGLLLTASQTAGRWHLRVRAVSGHGAGAGPGTGSKGGSKGSGSNPGSFPTPHKNADELSASGVVTNLDTDDIELQLTDNSPLSPTLPASALSYMSSNQDLNDCETITVSYRDTGAGPVLDALAPTGISTAPISESLGDTCADESDGGTDVVGTITQLGLSSLTINVPGTGAMTFSVDPTQDLLDGNAAGDVVDVTYTTNSDGSLAASDVEWVEEYTTGTITAISSQGGTMSVFDAVTGNTDTFYPGDATFSGFTAGQQVGIDYWVSGGQLQADQISPLPTTG